MKRTLAIAAFTCALALAATAQNNPYNSQIVEQLSIANRLAQQAQPTTYDNLMNQLHEQQALEQMQQQMQIQQQINQMQQWQYQQPVITAVPAPLPVVPMYTPQIVVPSPY